MSEKIVLFCKENEIPFHLFEAVQIFNGVIAPVEFVGNADEYEVKMTDGDGCVRASVPVSVSEAIKDADLIDEAYKLPVCQTDNNLQKRYLYKVISELSCYSSPWGAMTGVRPAKTVNMLKKQGFSDLQIVRHLVAFYLMSEEKAMLAVDTANKEQPFLENQLSRPENAGLYVHIPFCPTRCLYCSFTSNSIKKYKDKVNAYLDCLERELKESVQIAESAGLSFESVYIGGGTPTSLSEPHFERLMKIIAENVNVDGLKEYALEAGRPDSFTESKLLTAKNFGVTRISVNPQTMNDKTLKIIGREHTSAQTEYAFNMARRLGFDNINMDIIAGLPGENIEDFNYTLKKIEEMRPDSLTVHTLSIKRAADLKLDDSARRLLKYNIVGEMIKNAGNVAKSMSLTPYYMYRQKNMLGNHENTAYCRAGCESPYNIHIMEEDQTIIGVGAAAVTKRVSYGDCGELLIERAFNVKSVEEYLSRMPEMIERKKALFD